MSRIKNVDMGVALGQAQELPQSTNVTPRGQIATGVRTGEDAMNTYDTLATDDDCDITAAMSLYKKHSTFDWASSTRGGIAALALLLPLSLWRRACRLMPMGRKAVPRRLHANKTTQYPHKLRSLPRKREGRGG